LKDSTTERTVAKSWEDKYGRTLGGVGGSSSNWREQGRSTTLFPQQLLYVLSGKGGWFSRKERRNQKWDDRSAEGSDGRSYTVTYKDFEKLHYRFPAMLYPANTLLAEVGKSFLGQSFWKKKKRNFMKRREERIQHLDDLDLTRHRATEAKAAVAAAEEALNARASAMSEERTAPVKAEVPIRAHGTKKKKMSKKRGADGRPKNWRGDEGDKLVLGKGDMVDVQLEGWEDAYQGMVSEVFRSAAAADGKKTGGGGGGGAAGGGGGGGGAAGGGAAATPVLTPYDAVFDITTADGELLRFVSRDDIRLVRKYVEGEGKYDAAGAKKKIAAIQGEWQEKKDSADKEEADVHQAAKHKERKLKERVRRAKAKAEGPQRHTGDFGQDDYCDMVRGEACARRFCTHRYYPQWSCCNSSDPHAKYCQDTHDGTTTET
jgi:hypothetical protein